MPPPPPPPLDSLTLKKDSSEHLLLARRRRGGWHDALRDGQRGGDDPRRVLVGERPAGDVQLGAQRVELAHHGHLGLHDGRAGRSRRRACRGRRRGSRRLALGACSAKQRAQRLRGAVAAATAAAAKQSAERLRRADATAPIAAASPTAATNRSTILGGTVMVMACYTVCLLLTVVHTFDTPAVLCAVLSLQLWLD